MWSSIPTSSSVRRKPCLPDDEIFERSFGYVVPALGVAPVLEIVVSRQGFEHHGFCGLSKGDRKQDLEAFGDLQSRP